MKIKSMALGGLAANCYILINETTKEAAVIDPGTSPARILKELAGYTLRYILLTHVHFDHIGAVMDVKEATGAIVAAHKISARNINRPSQSLTDRFGRRLPHITVDMELEDGDALSFGGLTITALHTPGHTEGDCCYLCGDALFTGDVLFYREAGRTDFEGGSYPALLQSLQKLAALPGDYTVYPGHDRSTTLEQERLYNPYIEKE